MTLKNKIIVVAVLALSCISVAHSQTYDNPYYYLVRVSQTFSAWSDCWTTKDMPKQESTHFYMYVDRNDDDEKKAFTNETGRYYYYPLPIGSQSYHLINDTLYYNQQYAKVKNTLKVSNMNYNDVYKSEFFILKNQQYVKGGDKANCSWINPSHEGYNIATTIEFDDPVLINTDTKLDGGLDVNDPITIHFSNYNVYPGTVCNIYYYITEGENWKPIDNGSLVVSPNGIINIYYSDIFGVDNYNALGKRVYLCVGKTMFDGNIQYGEKINTFFTKSVPDRSYELLVSSCYEYLKIKLEDGELLQIFGNVETQSGELVPHSVLFFLNRVEYEKYISNNVIPFGYYKDGLYYKKESDSEVVATSKENMAFYKSEIDYDNYMNIEDKNEVVHGFFEDGYYYIDLIEVKGNGGIVSEQNQEQNDTIKLRIFHETKMSDADHFLEKSINIPPLIEPISVSQDPYPQTTTQPLDPYAILKIVDSELRTPYKFLLIDGNKFEDRTSKFRGVENKELPKFDVNYYQKVSSLISNAEELRGKNIKDWWKNFYSVKKQDWLTNDFCKQQLIGNNELKKTEWAECTGHQSLASVAIMPKTQNGSDITYLIFGEPGSFNVNDVGVFAVKNVPEDYATNWNKSYKNEAQYSLKSDNSTLQYEGKNGDINNMYSLFCWEIIKSNAHLTGFIGHELTIYRYKDKDSQSYNSEQIDFEFNKDGIYDNVFYEYVTGNGCKMLVRCMENGVYKYYEVCTNGTVTSHGRNKLNKKEIENFVTGVYNDGCSDMDGRNIDVSYYDNKGTKQTGKTWSYEWATHHCQLTYYDGKYIVYNSSVPYSSTGDLYIECNNVKTILYVGKDEQSHFVQYEGTDRHYYQKRFFADDDSEESVEVPGEVVGEWRKAFYELVYNYEVGKIGDRLYGVVLNNEESYILEDRHGCKTAEFKVKVEGDFFTKIDSVSPKSVLSNDGQMTIKYNGGKHKYYYNGSELEKGVETTIKGLGLKGNIELYDELCQPYTIAYDFGIGITSVKGSFCEGAVNETGVGKIEIQTLLKELKSFVLYKVEDNKKTVVERYPAIENDVITYTSDESHTFSNLDKDLLYSVEVEFNDKGSNSDGGKSVCLKWDDNIDLSKHVFSIENILVTDAFEINGEGKITGTIVNSIGNINWVVTDESNSTVLNGTNTDISIDNLKKGTYTINLKEDGYCTYEIQKSIKAPIITSEIKVINDGASIKMKINKPFVLTNASSPNIELYQVQEAETLVKVGKNSDNEWPVTSSDKYQIKLSYSNNKNEIKEIKLGEFNITDDNVNYNGSNYKFNYGLSVNETTLPLCYGDNIKHTIKTSSNNAIIVIPNCSYDKNSDGTIVVSTSIESLPYVIKDTTYFEDSNLGLKIIFSSEDKGENNVLVGSLIAPFSSSKIYIDDFPCYETEKTLLHIEGLNGGNSNLSILYSLNGNLWNACQKNGDGNCLIDLYDYKGLENVDTKFSTPLYLKNDGCSSMQNMQENIPFNRPSKLNLAVVQGSVNDPICQGTETGKFSVIAKGGTTSNVFNGYCYFVDPENAEEIKNEVSTQENYSNNYTVKDVTKQFENLFAGVHRIIVFDNNQCMASTNVELKEYKNPYVTAATFNSVSCYGLSDGAIMVNTIHGTAPIDKYRLYDNNSGTEKASITLTNEELDNVVTSYKGEAFERDYIWNPATGKSIVKFEGLPSAKYYLCLTDVNGCETIEPNERFPIDVLQPDSLILNIDYEDTIIANYGMLGGTVNAHVEGGNSGWFNVSVDGKSVDTIIQNYSVSLADIFLPGKHYIKVEDSKQCADSAYTGEMRQPDSKLHLTAQTVDAMCKSSTGSITVAASGGWGKYQYSCSTVGENLGFDTPEYIFTDLYGGTYKVSVNDMAGAVFDTTIIVNTPPELLATPMPQDATCRDDGKIAVKISGGVMPYRVYSENIMADTIFIDDTTYTNVAAFPGYYPSSTYEVYVKDTNECTSVASVIITDSIPLASVKFICPSFHSVSNGKLTAHVDNGTSPYRYLWTNRNTDLTFADSVWKNISAGTYCLTVTDAHDCVANSDNRCDLCWFEYVPTTGDKKLTIDTICNETGVGAQDGFVRIVSDTSGYREIILYSCSSQTDMTEQILDQRQFELSGLSCGPYVLECRLPQGEVRYASFVIQEYKPLQLYVNNMLHALTPDSEDGRATVVIADGKAPYQAIIVKNNEFYMDTLLETNKLNLDGLGSGIYNVTVVDLYGKKRSIDFDINAPQKPLTLITDSVENVSCFSYDNGVIHLNAEGGWGEYQFAMDGGKYGNSATFGNRVAGSYVFVVIDKRGVTDTLQVDVEQPEKLCVGNPIIDTVSCYGYFDGSVKFNISGGNGGYVTYSDHGVSVHGDYVDNLNSDTYKFYFSDEKRCPSLDTLVVFIPQPDSLSISETIRHTTCDENNGSIRISVDGGIQPYTYFWDDSTIEKSEDQSYVYGLRQLGLYNVKVVDKNGCGIDKSFRIESSTKPRISRVSTLPIKCTGDSNGTAMVDSADIIPASPFAPFRIVWPNGQNQMEVNDLPAGRFSVTIVDTNECSSDFDFEVKSQTPLSIVKDGSRDAHCYNYTDGAISVIAYGGVGKFRYLWSNGDTLPQISNIGMGSYTVVVTDANECHDTATYSIGQPDSLYVDLGRDIYMCPDNTYEFDPGVYATYEWKRNDTVLSTERVLAADVQGLYCLEVTNDAGCFSHDSVLVTIGNDLLQADFVMASDAPIDDTIALIELSSIAIDSLRWEFDKGVFETIDSTAYEIYLKPDTLGIQTITLWAYSGGCVSYQTKQIEIVEQSDTVETANYGYNPLIKSILLKPNPNDGQFVVEIELREISNVSAYISNVGTGAQVTSFNMSGDSKYSKEVNISNSGSGVYILYVMAADETRSVRFMITR